MKITEKMRTDLFYLDLNHDTVEWLRHDDKAYFGGQFISLKFSKDLLMEALNQYEALDDVMGYIAERAEVETSNYGTVDYMSDMYRITRDEPNFYGCTNENIQEISQLFAAKELLNLYTRVEFHGDAEFSDLRKVAIGYTTITDAEYPLQAYANLIDHRIEVYLDDRLAYFEQANSLQEMVTDMLSELSFEDLYSVPDWIIKKHEREMKVDGLAVRMTFFMKEHDVFTYLDILGLSKNDADMVAMVRNDLHNLDTYPGMIHEMQDMISNLSLTENEQKQCYEIMEELYSIYADDRFGSIEVRETECMIDMLDALGYKEYEVNFNEKGFQAVLDGEPLCGEEIYRYIEKTQSSERLRKVRNERFETFTDFKRLAEKHGVHINIQSKASPERSISR